MILAKVGIAGGSAARARTLSPRQTKHSVSLASCTGDSTPGSNPCGVFSSPRGGQSAQEAPVLADHRELYEFWSVVIGRRECYPVAAEVEVTDASHGVNEF